MAAEHVHDFGGPVDRAVRMCLTGDCTELHACVDGEWVPLTSKQQTQATLIMWEDTIMVRALSIVHGRERGLAHYCRMVGYDQ